MDVYQFGKRLDTTLKKVKQSKNRNTLIDFYRFCMAQGLTKGTIARQLNIMMDINSILNKPFSKANRKDIVNVLFWMENNGFSEGTKAKYRSTIKKFWKWLKATEEYPKEVSWFKAKKIRTHVEEILTKEEIQALIEAGKNIMEKTIIAILYESGCRPKELLSLRIKDVSFDEYGAILMVNGKNSWRRIRIVKYFLLLKKWLKKHPIKDTNYALWIGFAKKNRNKPMSYYSFYNTLRKIVKKSKINKKVNPYSFRHTRATHLANFLTEAQMCRFFGWVQGSEMPRVYVHLSGRDIDKAILKIYGIKV